MSTYKNGSVFVFSAGDSKMSITVRAKYLWASERSYLALSENPMNCWILSYLARCQPLEIQGFGSFFSDSAIFFIFLPSVSHKR